MTAKRMNFSTALISACDLALSVCGKASQLVWTVCACDRVLGVCTFFQLLCDKGQCACEKVFLSAILFVIGKSHQNLKRQARKWGESTAKDDIFVDVGKSVLFAQWCEGAVSCILPNSLPIHVR